MTLHEYEAYLDTLDARFRRHGSEVHVNFSRPFVIDLKHCSSVEGIFREARELNIRLADESNVNIGYLVERLIRLADEFEREGSSFAASRLHRVGHGRHSPQRGLDPRRTANAIGLLRIDDVVRGRGAASLGGPALRFENGAGEYAGVHFVQLERVAPDAVRVTRSVIGTLGAIQSADVAALDAAETDHSLLLFLPEALSWAYDPPVKDVEWPWIRGTRIQLRHSFAAHELRAIRSELQTLMEGLPFTYSCRKS